MTGDIVELDELKSAWQALDRRLERDHALNFRRFKDDRFDRIRCGLWPMRFWQIVRIAFGVPLVLFAAPVWVEHWHQPVLVVSGLLAHAYGIALCLTGARVLRLIAAIDYAAPVLSIQQRVAQLRTFYLRSSFWLGNAWWLLWAPALALGLLWVLRSDAPRLPDAAWDALFARFLPELAASTAVGVAGLLAFVWLYRALRRWKPDAVRRIEDRSSRGIADANRMLEEIARFERE